MTLVKACNAYAVVIGTPEDSKRLQLAKEIGADETILTSKIDGLLSQREQDKKFDLFLECSGAAKAVDMGLELLHKGGRYVQIGLFGNKVNVDLDKVVIKEIKLFSGFSHVWTAYDTALKLLSEELVITKTLVSHRFPLTGWEEAFEMFSKKDSTKVVFEP